MLIERVMLVRESECDSSESAESLVVSKSPSLVSEGAYKILFWASSARTCLEDGLLLARVLCG